MSCPKEKPGNPQCGGCLIKNSVKQEGSILVIDPSMAIALNWQTTQGDAWVSRPKAQLAHCAKGVEIQIG